MRARTAQLSIDLSSVPDVSGVYRATAVLVVAVVAVWRLL